MAEETKEKKHQVPTCAGFNENTEEMKRHLAVLREKKGATTTQHSVDFRVANVLFRLIAWSTQRMFHQHDSLIWYPSLFVKLIINLQPLPSVFLAENVS